MSQILESRCCSGTLSANPRLPGGNSFIGRTTTTELVRKETYEILCTRYCVIYSIFPLMGDAKLHGNATLRLAYLDHDTVPAIDVCTSYTLFVSPSTDYGGLDTTRFKSVVRSRRS